MKTSSLLLRAALAVIFGAVFAWSTAHAQVSEVRELTATAVSSTEIQLAWTRGDRDWMAAIERTGPDGKTFSCGITDASSFADRALEPDTRYTYTVTVTRGGGTQLPPLTATSQTLPWQNQDIGAVGAPGSVQRTGDVYTVTGSGADIDGAADAFHFVHQPWAGDGTMIVRVDSVANTAQWAKAGIMFRESLAPGSRYVMVCANPLGDSAIQSRASTNGPTEFGISVYTYAPQWLKLTRTGNTFQAFQTLDGVEWTLFGTVTVDLPANVYAGLAVTSQSQGTPCAAVFDGFNLSPSWTGLGPTVRDLVLTASSEWISATWSTQDHVPFFYSVEISRDVKFRTSAASVTPSSAVSFPAEPNTTYYARARLSHRDGLGLSSPILSITTPPRPSGITPASPSSLSAHAVSSAQVNLMWADNSDNETGFVIERSTDGQSFMQYQLGSDNSTSLGVMNLAPNTTYYFRVAAYRSEADTGFRSIFSGYSNVVEATTLLTPAGSPVVTSQPGQATAPLDGSAALSAFADGNPTYQWSRNGVPITGATSTSYIVNSMQPQDAGIYTATATNAGGSVTSEPGVIGVFTTNKVAGAGRQVGTDIRHPNGNIYDQVLLEGPAASITADHGQVTRLSYVDLNDDIVQVEFSGAGTLTLTLDNPSGPAPAAKYHQPDVSYMKGHATILIANANETTYVSVFSVGRANAVNQTLFRDGESHDGVADIALVSIMSLNGRFGGVFTGNAHYFNTRSLTGIFAPNVQFGDRVIASDITSHDLALPMLLLGQASDVKIAGGNLAQPTGRPVQVGMFARVQFVDGTRSTGDTLPAQSIQGRLEQNGRDVTTAMTSPSAQ